MGLIADRLNTFHWHAAAASHGWMWF